MQVSEDWSPSYCPNLSSFTLPLAHSGHHDFWLFLQQTGYVSALRLWTQASCSWECLFPKYFYTFTIFTFCTNVTFISGHTLHCNLLSFPFHPPLLCNTDIHYHQTYCPIYLFFFLLENINPTSAEILVCTVCIVYWCIWNIHSCSWMHCSCLYQFDRAALTNYIKMGALKEQTFIVS